MADNQFSLSKVKKDFNLTLDRTGDLFAEVGAIAPSNFLRQTLEEYIPTAIITNTEKARSELIIAPVMMEVRRQIGNQISLFSGSAFNVDSSKGLSGYCDFILSASREHLCMIFRANWSDENLAKEKFSQKHLDLTKS